MMEKHLMDKDVMEIIGWALFSRVATISISILNKIFTVWNWHSWTYGMQILLYW